jgi:hypothetical protein
MTTVVNTKTSSYDVYIGRSKTSAMHYGNPFSHLSYGLASVRVATREMSITAFGDWLNGAGWKDVEPERRRWILDHMQELKGKRLGCFCKPLGCHGDILAALLDS